MRLLRSFFIIRVYEIISLIIGMFPAYLLTAITVIYNDLCMCRCDVKPNNQSSDVILMFCLFI